ncbi:MAG: flagellar biosynthesis anti-sigma factor FlgM [Candidatus Zhuqueibacterota bacterium]
MDKDGKYSDIYLVKPDKNIGNDPLKKVNTISDIKNQSKKHVATMLYNEAVRKIALGLYDIRKYGDFEDACETAQKMLSSIEQDPPIREDKVALAKQRVRSGYYNQRHVIEQTVENLLKYMGM